MLMLMLDATDGQRSKEDASPEVLFYYFQMVSMLRLHQNVIEG
jgi:hypothetical protein